MSDSDDRRLERDAALGDEVVQELADTRHVRLPCNTPICPTCIRVATRFFDRSAIVFAQIADREGRGWLVPADLMKLADSLCYEAPRFLEILDRLGRQLDLPLAQESGLPRV